MDYIVQGNKTILDLWGKQKIIDNIPCRLMRYVIRVDYKDKVILHNVVTGQMVSLNEEELLLVEKLPAAYSEQIKYLYESHFIVPDTLDEHKQVVGLRSVLRKLCPSEQGIIKKLTILPTTACNARCYYCFEHGIKICTMTEQTAADIVTYIVNHCSNEKKVYITWFGGEPTVAANRIDQICKGLTESGIVFNSDMISNGYLFDRSMVDRAAKNWHIKRIQITFDGTETHYNASKAYVDAEGSPYYRVIRNIGLLLEAGIRVNVRMNFDADNYLDFRDLIEQLIEYYPGNPLLKVMAYPLIGDFSDRAGKSIHRDNNWFTQKLVELNDIAREYNVDSKEEFLPQMHFTGCAADNDYGVVINPEGKLTKCQECYQEDQVIGSIYEGITNHALLASWKELGDFSECIDCVLFPHCVKMLNCPGKGRCLSKQERLAVSEAVIKHYYDEFSTV